MLTVFANIRINSEARLQHLKSSFKSFEKISDNWLINIRGQYRNQAVIFLKNNLGKKIVLFELLDDERGWMNNSLEMIKEAKYDYILNWNEDHINLAPQELFPKIITSMKEENADYMMYSWWHFGKARSKFKILPIKIGINADFVKLTPKRWQKLRSGGHSYYIISSVSIFKKDFFVKLATMDSKKLPVKLSYPIFGLSRISKKLGIKIDETSLFAKVNKLFGNKLARYSKVTPHEIEKDAYRTDILPIIVALPKRELFACIDDNNGVDGYSLIERGVYP